jgi:catechol 2,3-dioxygenase-like lactoylglutathione lyase family enzyme
MSSWPSPGLVLETYASAEETTMPGPLNNAHTVAKLPAQDLERARAFYRDKLGLEAVEERAGGLRYLVGPSEFHLFSSSGKPSGESTQMAFEVENLEATIARARAPVSSARSSTTARATSSGLPSQSADDDIVDQRRSEQAVLDDSRRLIEQ